MATHVWPRALRLRRPGRVAVVPGPCPLRPGRNAVGPAPPPPRPYNPLLPGVIPALLLVALLLAGCAGTTTPREPAGGHASWQDVADAPWIVLSDGCGACSGDPDLAEHRALVLYPGGQLLAIRYGTGPDENRSGLQMAAGLERWRAVVEPVHESPLYGKRDGWLLLVHDVATDRIAGADRDRIHRVLESNLRYALDPGEPDFSDSADYGGVKVQVLPRTHGERAWDVHLDPFDHEEDAWGNIVTQIRKVQQWMEEA